MTVGMRQLLRRVRVFLAVAGLIAVLAGCQADAHVDVTMAEDGSGEVVVTVVLDEDAAARVPALADDLRVADLEATGWEVAGPSDTDDGGLELTAAKPFATAEQGRAVLREVGGRGGVLRGLTLARDHSFGETTWAFAGRLDFSSGLATFSDADLDAVLGAEAFGQDQAALEDQLGEPLSDTMSISITAQLPPGGFDSNGEQDGTAPRASWHADLGDEPVAMEASSSERDTRALAFAAGALAAAVLLVVLLLVRVIGGRRRRRREQRAVSVAQPGPSTTNAGD